LKKTTTTLCFALPSSFFPFFSRSDEETPARADRRSKSAKEKKERGEKKLMAPLVLPLLLLVIIIIVFFSSALLYSVSQRVSTNRPNPFFKFFFVVVPLHCCYNNFAVAATVV
jgi:hypothetical protein